MKEIIGIPSKFTGNTGLEETKLKDRIRIQNPNYLNSYQLQQRLGSTEKEQMQSSAFKGIIICTVTG